MESGLGVVVVWGSARRGSDVGGVRIPCRISNNQNSPQTLVPQQNFMPFTLPPPGLSTSVTAASSTRAAEPTYPTSMATDYPSESTHHQQSRLDRTTLDQMTASNTMPVFGDEGYNRSPFAIPEDFVAYLFSGQQIDNSSPIQIGQQGYVKLVFLSFSDAVS
jgi:hypothetical protein